MESLCQRQHGVIFLSVSVNVDMPESDNSMVYFSMSTHCSHMKNA